MADFASGYLFFLGTGSDLGQVCYHSFRDLPCGLCKRSFKVCDEVVDALDADAEAEHVRVYSGCHLLLRAELRMGRRCRMHDERLRVTHTAHMKDELKLGYKGCSSLETTLHTEGQHTAETMLEILAGKIMILVALETRIVHALYSRVLLEEFCYSKCVVAAALCAE